MIAVGPIPREEFAARVARVRERMVESGLDALVSYGAHVDYAPGDLRYLADWFCIEEEQALLIVPADGPITLLTDSSTDVDRAREQAVCDEVVLAGDLGGAAAVRLRGCSTAGLTGMRLLPAAAMDALRAGAPGVRLDDASALTAGLRMLKSPAEVALLAEAARISDLGMAAGLEAVRDGAREIEMAAVAEHAIRAAGAELSFTTVAGAGPRTALGTFLPGDRPMAAGEVVLLDCGARVHGYHGDMCRTVAVGEPPPELERALEAVAAAVEAGTAAARPGALVGELREAARGAVVAAGLGEAWWGEFMPHGAGTGQHEPPYGDRDTTCELREGMVLCIEPGALLPGMGGVVHEQMVAITSNGARVLNELPLRMWPHGVRPGGTRRPRANDASAMPHVDRLLARGEHIHLVSREHEVVLVGPFLRACIVLTACSYTAVRIAGTGVPLPLRLLAVGVLGLLAVRTLVRLARAVGRWQRRTLVVTDRRALLVHGGLSRRVAALPLDAIHDIEVIRARPGWVLHYGGLVISTGGRRDLLFGLRRLPDPDLLFGLLLGLADELPEPSSPPRWRLTPGGVPVAAG